MTSDLMRKVLVAGAAVAALSVAACTKPAAPVDASNTTINETTSTTAPAENAMAPADNAMAPAANSAS